MPFIRFCFTSENTRAFSNAKKASSRSVENGRMPSLLRVFELFYDFIYISIFLLTLFVKIILPKTSLLSHFLMFLY